MQALEVGGLKKGREKGRMGGSQPEQTMGQTNLPFSETRKVEKYGNLGKAKEK